MTEAITKLCASIYGESVGRDCARRLTERLTAWRAGRSPQVRAASGPLTERDCLLITYTDQVTEPGGSPLQSLTTFAERHLRGVVSGIHILPFYPWSSDDGFAVKDYFAVDPDYGTWDDLRRLGQNFDLMFDAVFNHLSAQSDWFERFLAGDPKFREFFVTVEGQPDLSQVIRPRALPLLTPFRAGGQPLQVWTTFSADQVDLNFHNPEALLATVDALLWYAQNGARFIRLDAIAFLWKEIGSTCLHLRQTHEIIQLWRAILEEVAPDVRLITETNVPHSDNISYFGNGSNEAHLVYNFALPPLVLHSLAGGDARQLTRWARTLTAPSEQVAFFNFLASHDGIGLNPVRGILSDAEIESLIERALRHGGYVSYKAMPDGSQLPYELNINYFDALSDPAACEPLNLQVDRALCAHAILLSLAGVPGIYFHSLFGSRGDRPGAERSGIPRRINREKVTRAAIEAELNDLHGRRRLVFQGMQGLLAYRRNHPAFAPSAPQRVLELGDAIFAVERSTADRSGRVWCLHNVSGQPARLEETHELPAQTLAPYENRWIDLSAPAPMQT